VLDSRDPGRAVDLCVFVDDTLALMLVADQERRDVLEAGHARLECGFRFALPDSMLDGRRHRIHIVENESGAMLPGGEAELVTPFEGVAFLKPGSCSLGGWARPMRTVVVRFDDAAPVLVTLNRKVAGFIANTLAGFDLPIPAQMMDGLWHRATVEHPVTGQMLDGSPVAFRLDPVARPVIKGVSLVGRRFHAMALTRWGGPLDIPVGVEIDGRKLLEIRSNGPRIAATPDGDGRLRNHFSFPVPPGAKAITLWHETGKDRAAIASYELNGTDVSESLPDLSQELSARTLTDPATLAAVNRVFDAFCARPGPGFDALWYNLTHLGEGVDGPDGAEAALEHYEKTGAAAGLSPSPYFSEDEVKAMYPQIAVAVAAGHVPCAFAVYLHLGQGLALRPVAGLDIVACLAEIGAQPQALPFDSLRLAQRKLDQRRPAETAARPQTPLFPASLPDATAVRDPAKSVYAAWMARLDTSPATRTRLEADEAAARQYIRSIHLTRQPLVSIIMPSFNRAYTIGDAIQSALDQTYDNFELLICDDGSFDKTPEVVKQFTDRRIRYMQFTKSNGAETRNKGLGFARGEYIAYLDSDNLWNPHFLDLMLRKLMARPGTTVAYGSYLDTETFGAQVKLVQTSHPRFNPVALSNKNFMDLNTIMHHRRAYDWLGGFDKTLLRLQDWDLMLRYTSVFQPLFVDHCMVYYRRNVAWGQVTNLFMNSGATDFVNAKTSDRLDRSHVRLAIDWKTRDRLVVLAGDSSGAEHVALAFAGLAAAFADITLIGGLPAGAVLPEGVTHEPAGATLHTDADRFAYLLSGWIGNSAVISFDMTRTLLERLAATVSSEQIYRAVMTSDGLVLQSHAAPDTRLHLGTLPLRPEDLPPLPEADAARMPLPERPTITLLPLPEAYRNLAALAAQTATHAVDLLVPPEGLARGLWLRMSNGVSQPVGNSFEDGLSACLRGTQLAVVCPKVADLPVAAFALITQLQGHRVPLAVAPGPQADDWIETRCAYRIDVNSPDWILSKAVKLMQSRKDYDKLSQNSAVAHNITHHPELVQERIAVFMQAVQSSAVIPEVYHDVR